MRIVLASSEAVPFSKTGGLADVAGALPKALAQLGHEVTLIIPNYPSIQATRHCPDVHSMDMRFDVQVGQVSHTAELLWSTLPDSEVRVILVHNAALFDRDGLYQENGEDYRDNSQRFIFFARAILEAARRLSLRPHVVHVNDWQTGLVPALLEIEARQLPEFAHTVSVLTLHNLAFQGSFWHWDMLLTGLDWKYFNWRQMESYGRLNLLKTGMVFANRLTTVSPTYAREIQTPEAGCGLEGVLQTRAQDLVGILNGIDDRVWNPASDPHLPANYSVEQFSAGKQACREALRHRMGLPESTGPVFGMVSRMTDQKGFDLLAEQAERILERDLQLVFLGTGDARYELWLRGLAEQHPEKVAVLVGFDEQLAHLIEAGSDIYLMPSRFEPCGLNQMYSLAYGTVPIVRAVGGLADTVVNTDNWTLAAETANGFSFANYSSEELLDRIDRALEYFAKPDEWRQIVHNGMSQDWSWTRSARQYSDLYELAVSSRRRSHTNL